MQGRGAPIKRRRGFTMTELAIVLGVIGLVLGGIWTAAGVVQRNAQVNRASEQLGLIATNMQTLYAGRNVAFSALNPPATFTPPATTAQYAGQGIFPLEMVSGTAVNDPWGGPVYAGLVGTAGNPVQFVVEYQNVPASACTGLVANNSTPGRDTGLMQIVITPNGGPALPPYNGLGLPVSPSTLAGVCVAADEPFIIDWYYKLGQGCAAGSPC